MEDKTKRLEEKLFKLQLERQEKALDMYFNKGITNMSEIGRQVGLTRERVRQLIERAKQTK